MRFAYIENGVVYDAISVKPETVFYPDYASRFVIVPDEVQSGWTFDGTNFLPPPDNLREDLVKEIRARRDARLQESDWTQAADVPQATRDKWAPYRQALRDVPQQAGFPDNIQWPTKPE